MNGVSVAHTDGDLLGHANAEEYEALIVQGSPDRDYHLLRMRQRQAFVELYPDLRIWPAEPLDIRAGRLFHESRTAPTSMVNFKARTYLTFLALTGRLRLDHDWLLSVPHVNVWDMAGRLDLHTLLRAEEELAEQATLLGYHVRSARRGLRRALARLACTVDGTTSGTLGRSCTRSPMRSTPMRIVGTWTGSTARRRSSSGSARCGVPTFISRTCSSSTPDACTTILAWSSRGGQLSWKVQRRCARPWSGTSRLGGSPTGP